MAVGNIDLNKFVQSFYKTVVSLNTTVSDAVGIDMKWMRAVPHDKSEDVIFQEYTLYDVACPVSLKAVTTNSSYNPGNFQVDLFGINYEAPFEIQIDMTTWQNAMGKDTEPQKGDIVYVEILNCLYEVATSAPIYGFAEQETGFKVQLTKYNPAANRRESDGVAETIESLTASEQDLFSGAISDEVADIVDAQQTSPDNGSEGVTGDNFRASGGDAVVSEEVSVASNTVSRAYYDMNSEKASVLYKTTDTISTTDHPVRYFSCWVKITSASDGSLPVVIEQTDRNVFSVVSGCNYPDGTVIEVSRGKFVTVHASVSTSADGKRALTFNSKEFRSACSKLTGWWKGGLKTGRPVINQLLVGHGADKCVFDISLMGSTGICVKAGKTVKNISFDRNIPVGEWIGVCVNIGKSSDVNVFSETDKHLSLFCSASLGNMASAEDIIIDSFGIGRCSEFISNIRLYAENEAVDAETEIKDLSSELVANASRSIINDSCAASNNSPFISSQR